MLEVNFMNFYKIGNKKHVKGNIPVAQHFLEYKLWLVKSEETVNINYIKYIYFKIKY